MAWNSGLDIASSVLAIVALVYFFGFWAYMVYLVVAEK
jgi:hypothetical protein